MRNDERQIEEEWSVAILVNKLKCFFRESILRIGLPFRCTIVTRKYFLRVIAPQEFRVVVVGLFLTQIAIKQVKSMAVWLTGRSRHAEAPFADGGRGVAVLLQKFGNGDFVRRKWLLTGRFPTVLFANLLETF